MGSETLRLPSKMQKNKKKGCDLYTFVKTSYIEPVKTEVTFSSAVKYFNTVRCICIFIYVASLKVLLLVSLVNTFCTSKA